MKKRISNILYGCGIVLFLCWMFFSTDIIATISGLKRPKTVDFSSFQNAIMHDAVYFNIENYRMDNSLLEPLSFSGYTFAVTDNDDSGRYVSFILKQDNGLCYELPMDIMFRPEIDSFLGMVKTRNYLGFSGEFTGLQIENGLYDLYIYCWENDNTFGLRNTGFQVYKDGTVTEMYLWRGEPYEKPIALTSNEIIAGNLESITLSSNYVDIYGWGCIWNLDSATQNAYLEFADSHGKITRYTTKSSDSKDVVDVLSSELYGNSRYSVSIPSENLPDGLYDVRVLIENGQTVQSSPVYIMYKSFDCLLYGLPNNTEFADRVVNNLSESELQPEYKEALHYLEQDGSYTSLSLVQAPAVAEGQRVLLKLNMEDGGEKYLFCQPDSTRLPGAFRLTVPGDIMPELESYQVCTTDGALLYVNEDRIVPALNGEKIPQEALSAYDPSRFTEPQIAQAEIMEDGCLLVSGWTIVQGEDSGDETHYIRLDYPDKSTAFIRALTVYRPDVSIYLGDGRYDWSGFYALIGPEYLDPQPETFTVATDTGDALLIAQNVYSAQPDGSR